MRRLFALAAGLSTLMVAALAFAGGGGNAPGGGEGGGGAEPELIALILFSLVPGLLFTRKLVAARRSEPPTE